MSKRVEEYIENYTNRCSNEVGSALYREIHHLEPEYSPWLTPDQARRAVEIAREEIYEWLLNHNDYITVNGNITSYDMEKLVKDLKQAMNHE